MQILVFNLRIVAHRCGVLDFLVTKVKWEVEFYAQVTKQILEQRCENLSLGSPVGDMFFVIILSNLLSKDEVHLPPVIVELGCVIASYLCFN